MRQADRGNRAQRSAAAPRPPPPEPGQRVERRVAGRSRIPRNRAIRCGHRRTARFDDRHNRLPRCVRPFGGTTSQPRRTCALEHSCRVRTSIGCHSCSRDIHRRHQGPPGHQLCRPAQRPNCVALRHQHRSTDSPVPWRVLRTHSRRASSRERFDLPDSRPGPAILGRAPHQDDLRRRSRWPKCRTRSRPRGIPLA